MSKDEKKVLNLEDYISPEKNQELGKWIKDTGHKMPVTRRDFLKAGLIKYSGWVMAPSLTSSLYTSIARAQDMECPAAAAVGGNPFVPVVTISLNGGIGMPGMIAPMGADRSTLTSYNQLRLGTVPTVDTAQFKNGAPIVNMPAADAVDNSLSVFHDTLNLIPAADRAKTNVVSMWLRSRDDNSSNQITVDGLLERAGSSGAKFGLLGIRGDRTAGVDHQPALITPTAPTVVNRIEDLLGAVGLNQPLGRLTLNQQIGLARTVENLSSSQATQVQSLGGGANLMTGMTCGTKQNVQLISDGSGGVDPRLDADPVLAASLAAIWNNFTDNRDQQHGSMVYNTIKGNAMSCGLEIGGCDYHNNGNDRTAARDGQLADTIQKVIRTASAMNQPVMIYCITDGAVSAQASDTPGQIWRNDSGSRSGAFMFLFDPADNSAVSDFQIGHFTNGQAADDDHPVGSATRTAIAFFVNWALASGQPQVIDQVLQGVLTTAERAALTVVTQPVG